MRYRLRLWDAKASFTNVFCNPFVKEGDIINFNGKKLEVLRRIAWARELTNEELKGNHNSYVEPNADEYDELIVKEIPTNI